MRLSRLLEKECQQVQPNRAGETSPHIDIMEPPNLRNALICSPPELGLLPMAVLAGLDSASILESIKVREVSLTPLMEEILRSRPSSHWGINE